MTATLRLRPSALPSPASWLIRASPSPTLHLFLRPLSTSAPRQTKKNKSQWIARQQQDPYVRARAAANSPSTSPSSAPPSSTSFVARSAFKLLELHQTWHGEAKILRPGMTVVDLGAAPGGWIQAAFEVLQGRATVVGVDLLPLQRGIDELDGVHFVRGDFLDPVTQAKVRRALREAKKGEEKPAVDLVLSDMMGSMSGSGLRDAQLSLDLSEAALAFAVQHLSPYSPTSPSSISSPSPASPARTRTPAVPPVQLIIKHFTSQFSPDFRRELQRRFALVKWIKPPSSRGESREGFFVCAGFKGREEAE
ncbi:hypothetical protein JCM8097_004291 [Rhodosporidiobolus ruineniae]